MDRYVRVGYWSVSLMYASAAEGVELAVHQVCVMGGRELLACMGIAIVCVNASLYSL